ncbi:piggyBac transposable element-derived protein 4-like [Engraulis encrasicolus]
MDVDDIIPPQPSFNPARAPGPQVVGGVQYTILQLFMLFMTRNTLQTIVNHSNIYGQRNHPHRWHQMSLEDLLSYIGMVIYMGLVGAKSVRDYWAKNELYNFPFPTSMLSGRRFAAVSSMLHISHPDSDAENDRRRGTQAYDRLCKIRPLYDEIRTACKAHYHPQQHIAVDERMVKSKARSILRQYMKDKPTKWGYKLFVLADSSNGYTWDFFVYEGRNMALQKGLSYDSVMNLVDTRVLGQGYKLYVDNFYTSPTLFKDLLAEKVWACGTIREQRIGYPRRRPGALTSQSPRGTIRWIRDDPVLFVQWKDTRDVRLCSTMHTAHNPQTTVQRRVRGTDGRWQLKSIPAPPAVTDYNKHMGGVDLSDAMIGFYNTVHKTRKWHRTFFYHFLDIAIVNAFVLHSCMAAERHETPLTQKAFREALVLELKAAGSPSTGPPPSPAPAPQGAHHKLRHYTEDGTAGRRRCVNCSLKSTTECTSCQVVLCFTVKRDCYNEWHTKNNL